MGNRPVRRKKNRTPIVLPVTILIVLIVLAAVMAWAVRSYLKHHGGGRGDENTGELVENVEYLDKEDNFGECYIMMKCSKEDGITADRVPGNKDSKSVPLKEGQILHAIARGTADGETYYHLDDDTYVTANGAYVIQLQSYRPMEGYIVISYVSTKGVNIRSWVEYKTKDNIVGSAFVGDKMNIVGEVVTVSGDSAYETEDGTYITTDTNYIQDFTIDPEKKTGEEKKPEEGTTAEEAVTDGV